MIEVLSNFRSFRMKAPLVFDFFEVHWEEYKKIVFVNLLSLGLDEAHPPKKNTYTVLGYAAGAWLRHVFDLMEKKADEPKLELTWRCSPQTTPLLEIGLWLKQKCIRQRRLAPRQRIHVLKEVVKKTRLGKPMRTLQHLVQSGLF